MRLAVLCIRATGFACRTRNQVAYLSQSGDPIELMRRKQGNLGLRLDKGWKRPKGMHAVMRNMLVRQTIDLNGSMGDGDGGHAGQEVSWRGLAIQR